MKVLVTGTAGFIGSHVAMRLLDRGDEVVGIDNLNDYYDVGLKQARLDRFRPQPLHQAGVVTIGDEADVLAVGLVGDDQPLFLGKAANLAFRQVAEREAQEIELLLRRAVEEIALVTRGVGTLVKLDAAIVDDATDVMPGREAIGA